MVDQAMTLLPVEQRRISVPRKQNWPRPRETWKCAAPGCPERGGHGHHIVRRSYTGNKPVDWVVIDEVVVWNKARLCWRHHAWVDGDIGGHRAKIVWDGAWIWCERVGHWAGEPRFTPIGLLELEGNNAA